jgi:dihydroxyacetone kinase-like protein
MGLTRDNLAAGLARIADHMEAVADELNSADGKLGDGDLGITMLRGSRAAKAAATDLPADVGAALMKVAQAFTQISGSSFGTLVATGLMSAAKAARGREDVSWAEMSSLLKGAREAMQTRGKASLGDKTVLDTLEAAGASAAGLDQPDAILTAAKAAVAQTMDDFRDRQAKIGRARIFAEKSVGLDDPGMLAFKRILEAL